MSDSCLIEIDGSVRGHKTQLSYMLTKRSKGQGLNPLQGLTPTGQTTPKNALN